MAEIPDHHRAGRVRARGQGGHVAPPTGAVVDLVDQHHRHGVVDQPLDVRAVHALEPHRHVRTGRHDALDDVEIGREAAALGDDDVALRPEAKTGMQSLVEIERGGVAGDHLAGCRADQRRDQIAGADRQLEPACVVPAADQALRPLGLGRGGDRRQRRLGRRPERVAVEIDHPRRQAEPVAKPGQRIGGIGGLGLGQRRSPEGIVGHRAPSPGLPDRSTSARPRQARRPPQSRRPQSA